MHIFSWTTISRNNLINVIMFHYKAVLEVLAKFVAQSVASYDKEDVFNI